MSRYIETTDAINVLSLFYNYTDDERYDLALAISAVPTADVVERKKAKWIDDGKGLYKCSGCGELWTHWWSVIVPPERMYKMMRFCPTCGAEMIEKE